MTIRRAAADGYKYIAGLHLARIAGHTAAPLPASPLYGSAFWISTSASSSESFFTSVFSFFIITRLAECNRSEPATSCLPGGLRLHSDRLRNDIIKQRVSPAGKPPGIPWNNKPTNCDLAQVLAQVIQPAGNRAAHLLLASDGVAHLFEEFLGAAFHILCSEDLHQRSLDCIISVRRI